MGTDRGRKVGVTGNTKSLDGPSKGASRKQNGRGDGDRSPGGTRSEESRKWTSPEGPGWTDFVGEEGSEG